MVRQETALVRIRNKLQLVRVGITGPRASRLGIRSFASTRLGRHVPILLLLLPPPALERRRPFLLHVERPRDDLADKELAVRPRSEERRVGKECRPRWSA